MENELIPESAKPHTDPTPEELYMFARAVNFAANVRMTEWPDGFSVGTDTDRLAADDYRSTVDGTR